MQNRTDKDRRTFLDHPGLAPRAVRHWIEMWLGGIGIALALVTYGAHCLITGHAILVGGTEIGGMALDVFGPAALGLAIAYISMGVLIHVHCFWRMHRRLAAFCPVLRIIAFVVFLGSFGFAIGRIVWEWGR